MTSKELYVGTSQKVVEPPAVCRIFSGLVSALSRVSMAVSATCVLVALLLISYSVIVRYVMGQPSLWVDEVVGFLVIGIVMFGAASALREGRHIGVDLLTERLGPRGQRWMQAWSMLVVLILSIFLMINGWETAMFSRMVGLVSQGYLELPMYWFQLLMPFGGFMLAIASIDALLRVACGASAHVTCVDKEEKY